MAAKKFLRNVAGTITEVFGIQTSAGAGNAGDVAVLDDTGRFDSSLMPVGVAAPTATITTSEALADGDFVNIWNSAGTFKVRKADGSTSGKEAHGFVLASYGSAAPATVYFPGDENTHVTGATAGVTYLSATTPGGFQSTAPTATGQIIQRLGVAVLATEIVFEPSQPIVLA